MLPRLLIVTLFAAITAFSQTPAGPPIEPGVSQALAQWRAVNYSNVSYKLNLTIEKMSPVLKGSIEIHVTQAAYACAEPNCPPLSIILDWRKIAGHEKDSTISNVTINGSALSPRFSGQPPEGGTLNGYEERSEHLIFRDGVRMGENVIKLDFTSPILTSGSAITRYVDKEDGSEYLYSLFVPSDASTAFPVFDQPDLKARFTLHINLLKDWRAVSNGKETCVSIDSDPWLHCGFEETKPISTYVFAFAAGPFEQVADLTNGIDTPEIKPRNVKPELKEAYKNWLNNNISISMTPEELKKFKQIEPENRVSSGTSFYVRKSQAAKFQPHAAEVFRLTHEGIKYLEQYFDYKFPFPKYDLVLIPEFPFGGMEHAGATFLKESSVIFPTEPTKNDQISRANLIFHETAHQWFGDTVTMKWFDDLWLKEGFAEFMAYKTLEKVMPEANAWKVFYERNKQAAYLTDSTRGTTPIYQPIANLASAKSAYGNIVYRKAPSFLRQAEFYLGEQKFQTAVRAFLKKHAFGNAGWEDLVKEFEGASGNDLKEWGKQWVTQRGMPVYRLNVKQTFESYDSQLNGVDALGDQKTWAQRTELLYRDSWIGIRHDPLDIGLKDGRMFAEGPGAVSGDNPNGLQLQFVFPNYGDYGYGIFLLDDKSRDYVLKNIGSEKDPFLRSMMWGSLWDSVREAELDPKDYVELAIRALSPGFSRPAASKKPPKGGTPSDGTPREDDETIIQSLLGRVGTAMNYYLPDAQRNAIAPRLEAVLLDRLQNAPTAGQRITFYRAFVTTAATAKGREVLREMLAQGSQVGVNHPVGETPPPLVLAAEPASVAGTPQPRKEGSQNAVPLRTKDKFDIVTRLIILGDADAPKLLAQLEKTETGDDARRYAYAAKAGYATAQNKARYWSDFTANKDISESWIEAAFGPFNSVRQSDLTLPYLERALAELPNHKRTRKIFFVNGWLGAFIGGQKSEAALAIVNKFLADTPNLDNDLRLKILENVDLIERAVKIRKKFGHE